MMAWHYFILHVIRECLSTKLNLENYLQDIAANAATESVMGCWKYVIN